MNNLVNVVNLGVLKQTDLFVQNLKVLKMGFKIFVGLTNATA